MAADLSAFDALNFDPSHYDPNHYLVQFRDAGASNSHLGTSLGGATVTRQVSSDGWFQATVDAGSNLAGSMRAFQGLSDVIVATPDFRLSLDAVPGDPQYSQQWALENTGATGLADADIDASQAWDYGTSTSVVVAVIDTGIDYNHPDLRPNIWNNTREVAGNGIDDDHNGYVDDIRGWNFVTDTNNPMDDNGHGTHVAGTIGAVGNNGIGVTGIAWNAKLMALKFLDSTGSGLLSDAVSAIDYARNNGAKIINASWGGGGFSSALQSAIQRFQDAGGIFVTAAGNESSNNAVAASYPANYALAGVISVAASTSSDTLASFSNYGTNVDIAAPGVSILSTVPNNSYASYSGTSMATPHVAGAMALLWGQSPSLTATQLIDLVMSNTDSVLRDRTIHGRLNVGKAAAALHGNTGGTSGDTLSPYVTASTWNSTSTGMTSVDITFSEAIRAGSLTTSSVQLSGPSGAIAISSITALSGAKYRIAFANQTTAGTYTVTVVPTVADLSGNLLDQDRDGKAGEATQDRFASQTTLQANRTYTTVGPVTLQDATYYSVGVTRIPIDVAGPFTVSDLNVNLSIDHTYVSDLRVRLISPDGTAVTLVNRRGGSRDNIRVLFDDEANTSVASVAGNLSGTLRPEGLLSAFDGINAAGRWTLEVTDAARWDIGKLNSVELRFTDNGTSAAASTPTSGPSAQQPSPLNNNTWPGWLAYIGDMFTPWWRRHF
jgi:subtilisin family serine protease/subtilisin-like proprotein convertase family protein